MALLSATSYQLDFRKAANWTANQEKTISTEYPFQTQREPLDQYVARIYLQFLWLPESIMPLHLLIPSLRRVDAPSTSKSTDATVHPMHALLEPLLLTTRLVANKYHVELPQILADGGGAGEMEETMMWYSLTHEKGDESTLANTELEGPWVDDTWRQKYMERMERREAQIQILLLLYKLSLPGLSPPEKKRTKRLKKTAHPSLTIEDRLEAFMDKLSTWQLVGALDRTATSRSSTGTSKSDEHDWTQTFTQNVVEPEFKVHLPEMCSLLRSKVFPNSPFSDLDADDASNAPTSRGPSPEPRAVSRGLSRAPSKPRIASPTLSTSSRIATTGKSKSKPTAQPLARSRSRSLSVSLAQEQEERQHALNNPAPKNNRKHVLNREISMSRAFKPKPKIRRELETMKSVKTEAPPPPKPRALDLGITLVEETPVKPRVGSATGSMSFGRPDFSFSLGPSKSSSNLPLGGIGEDGEEDEWVMDSSPDITFLNPKRGGSQTMESDDDDHGPALATPTRRSKKRR